MRILAIRGSNLASLTGEFEIDFEAEPLAGSGIFAITGPTGAGKSTLLDAVCLALFAEIPRLRAAPTSGSVGNDENGIAARDPRSILRHGTADGYAEVDFAMPAGGVYRARWSVRRARGKAEGRLQNHEHAFERLDTSERMGGTRTETLRAIAAVIGLTAEQFTRAVLLAQGDFEAFIRADANERAALLERLTGSQIYTRLGRAAYEKAQGLRAGLDSIRQRIAALHGLDDQGRAVAEAELAEAEAAHAAASEALEALGAQKRRAARARELANEISTAEQALDAAKNLQALAADRRDALARNRALLRFVPLWTARENARSVLQEADDKRTAAQNALSNANGQLEMSAAAARTAANALKQQEREAEALTPVLAAARALDRQLADTSEALMHASQEADALAKHANEAEESAAAAEGSFAQAQTRIANAAAWCTSNAALRTLHEREEELSELIAARASSHTQSQEAQGRLVELEREETLALARHATTLDAVRIARENLGAATRHRTEAEAEAPAEAALDALSREIDLLATAELRSVEFAQASRDVTQAQAALEETRAAQADAASRRTTIVQRLAEYEASLPDLETQVRQARHVLAQSVAASGKAAEFMRAELVDGEPCPVCGAQEHPLSALETLLGTHLESNRRHAEALEQELSRQRSEQQSLTRERETLSAREEALTQEESSRAEALMPLQDKAGEANRTLRAALLDVGLDSSALPSREDLARHRDERVQKRQDALSARQIASQSRDAQDLARKALDDMQQSEDAARVALAARAQALSEGRAMTDRQNAEMQNNDRALDRALAAFSEWRQLPDAGSWLRKQAETWRSYTAEQSEAETALPGLDAQRHEAVRTRDLARIQAKAAAATKLNLANTRVLKSAERSELLEGRSVAEVEETTARASGEARQANEVARQVSENAARLFAGSEAALKSAVGNHDEADVKYSSASAALDASLSSMEVAEHQLAQLAKAGQESIDAEAQALAALDTGVGEALAVLSKCHADLERHTAEAPENEELTPELLPDALMQAKGELEGANAAREQARLRILQDDQVRARTSSLRAELEAATSQADVWLRLSDLIGDREGKAFRRFAQGLTLDRLLEHANTRLAELKPRYALERGTGGEMLVQVVDNDMGGQVRGLHNLSGGERFLVSLALALGLAEMSSGRGVKIESLFIDEGFGALDPASLGQALALLEHLHASGRRVGVISHVEELKERVPVKIEVTPTGRGTSTIGIAYG
jgi:exonuclease SbcC